MNNIYQHASWLLAVFAILLLVAFGLDASPTSTPVPADASVVVTRPVEAVVTRPVEAVAEGALPREDGVPVLPARQAAPAEFTFATAAEAVRLVAEAERIERPGVVERIVIPKIEVATDVAQVGVVLQDGALRYETPNHIVGQYRGVNPGQGSNVVLAGHVGTRDGQGGSVFRNLNRLDLGDSIQVFTDAGAIDYEVTEVRFVAASATEIMAATDREQLTLVTCRSCNVNCQRLVVIARPVAAGASVRHLSGRAGLS